MVLFEDSRQQAGQHKNIHAYCEKVGVDIIRTKLLIGDYMLSGPEFGGLKGDISVDTKYGVLELAGNVFQSHDRFREQCERAQRCGVQLIVLTEEALPGGRLENWQSPRGRDGKPISRVDPARLKKAMLTMQEKYGVKFRFCDARSTGKVLIEYLEGKRK